MVQMFVNRVGLDLQKRAFVVLADTEEQRFLPILIGPFEARAIAMATHTPGERPLTHELLGSVIQTMGCSLDRIEITDLKDQVFYALLRLKGSDGTYEIDARPSDAIALALYADAPIFVAEQVLDGTVVLSAEAEEKEKEEFRDLLSGLFSDSDAPDETS